MITLVVKKYKINNLLAIQKLNTISSEKKDFFV
jgi:hypothetical protein